MRELPSFVLQSPIIDDFDINWSKTLGTGISGRVRIGETRNETKENFAIKVLIDSDKAREEVEIHWKICHELKIPGIVNIERVYLNDIKFPGERERQPRLLLVSEYCHGGELLSRLSKLRDCPNGLSEKDAAKMVRSIEKV